MAGNQATAAQKTTSAGPWRYELLPDSRLIDDCPPCGRPTIPQPLRGTFDLRLLDENPLFSTYALENISFTAGHIASRSYKISGSGTYTVGGEVALVQDLSLAVHIDDGSAGRLCFLTNGSPQVGRLWPILQATVIQTNGTFTQVYHLDIFAAPLRELWFSTAHGMTPGIWDPPNRRISGGDLLSSAGRVVKQDRELSCLLNLIPSPDPSELTLDALDVIPGGEIVFSLREDKVSGSLGPLQHGDLLSSQGRIVKRNRELTAAFSQMPPAPDAGLDAVQVMADGEVYFSIQKDFFSEALGRRVRNGDVLSSRGVVVKSQEELLSRFRPRDPKLDHGLDALHVWPSGEVWFSVESGFQGPHFENYGHGDLLSDQGYVVARNLDLVGPFQPLEDLADFGLDGLFLVTDMAMSQPPPRFTRIRKSADTGIVELRWEAKGRVFQLMRASDPAGPYQPVTEILPDLFVGDTPPAGQHHFYQLRQW